MQRGRCFESRLLVFGVIRAERLGCEGEGVDPVAMKGGRRRRVWWTARGARSANESDLQAPKILRAAYCMMQGPASAPGQRVAAPLSLPGRPATLLETQGIGLPSAPNTTHNHKHGRGFIRHVTCPFQEKRRSLPGTSLRTEGKGVRSFHNYPQTTFGGTWWDTLL